VGISGNSAKNLGRGRRGHVGESVVASCRCGGGHVGGAGDSIGAEACCAALDCAIASGVVDHVEVRVGDRLEVYTCACGEDAPGVTGGNGADTCGRRVPLGQLDDVALGQVPRQHVHEEPLSTHEDRPEPFQRAKLVEVGGMSAVKQRKGCGG
jgi:hypothetical protein